ncbi:MAG: hypothetical protein RIS47_1303 [Bacteroidota bacterium]|jgi:hypothetical protein
MKAGYLNLVTFFVFFACTPSVYFETPQPESKKDLKEFPSKIRGVYWQTNDSVLMKIDAQAILLTKYILTEDTVNSLIRELGFVPQSDTVVKYSAWETVSCTIKDSIIFTTYARTDTLFSVERGDLLRKYKGHYFLNRFFGKNMWDISTLNLEQGLVQIAPLVTTDELVQMPEVSIDSPLVDSTKIYLIKPEAKDLKKMLKSYDNATFYVKQK